MNLILTMAGRSKTFADEGYKTPKYLLPWGDRTLLWALLDEFNRGHAFEGVWLICNQRDEAFMPHVRAIMKDRGVDPGHLVLIGDTGGQAQTAAVGLDAVTKTKSDGPVVFHNVDTILYRRDYSQVAEALRRADGYIDVFGSSNRDYSYVLVEGGRVKEIAEKIVVSNLATSGFYGFSSAAVYRKHYREAEDTFISHVYKRLIAGGGTVVVGERHKEADTVVLGTPNEYTSASLLHFH